MPKPIRKRVTTRSPKRRKRRTSEELMDKILAAAAKEFRRAGYAGATTAAIARKADVTEAQLFRYFRSKSDLFREAIFRPLDAQLQNFSSQHLPQNGSYRNFRETAVLYIDELQQFVGDNVDLITSLVAAQLYEVPAARGKGAIASLGKYFERGAATMKERLKAPAKVAPELMVRVSFAAVLACVMFKDWIFPPGLTSDEAIRKAIDDFVLEGISANAVPDDAA